METERRVYGHLMALSFLLARTVVYVVFIGIFGSCLLCLHYCNSVMRLQSNNNNVCLPYMFIIRHLS